MVSCSNLPLTPAQIDPADPAETVVLRISAQARSSSEIPSVLRPGSNWRYVGDISQGQVYEPVDGGLNVKDTDSHEAYAVVDRGHLVGYWLPNEEAFTLAKLPVELRFTP